MKIYVILAFVITLSTVSYSNALNPFNILCWNNPWEISECKVTTLYEDGESASTVFIPEKNQNLTTGTCFKLGCHPLYCSDWRDSIRQGCKKEYARQQKIASKLLRGQQKKVASETFEGCAVLPVASGALYPVDYIGRKTMPESWFSICSLDTQAEENAFYTWAKNNSSALLDWFKKYGSAGWETSKEYAASGWQGAKNIVTQTPSPLERSQAAESIQMVHSRTTAPFGAYTRNLVAQEKGSAGTITKLST